MKIITLSGRESSGKTTRARELFEQHKAQGLHVVFIDDAGERLDTSHPGTPHDRAAVLIVTQVAGTDLREEVRDGPPPPAIPASRDGGQR